LAQRRKPGVHARRYSVDSREGAASPERKAIPEATRILIPTFVALLLGALVGLERQVAEGEAQGEKDFPGVRTFAFTALLGALAVLLHPHLGPAISVALFLAAVTFLVLRYRHQVERREDVGYTTEIASMCTFAVGALAQSNQLLVATVVTIAMVALLRSKRALHQAGDLLSPVDMEILIRFLVISLIIFPLLPQEPLPVFEGVLRPRDVWRMVVLISGVSFVGYALMRFRAGSTSYALTGMLAGLVSSTAAAFAYMRAARGARNPRQYEALIVLAASTAFLRILIMLAIVAPVLVPRVVVPLSVMSIVGVLLVALRHQPGRDHETPPQFDNPLAIRVALTFAAIYATVLVLVHLAQDAFDSAAIYGLAGLAAIPGADAPSLSLARLAADGRLDLSTAATGVIVVAVATTLAKLGILLVVGRRVALRTAASLLGIAAVGAAFLYVLVR
jgi:uncharacterized membrane protein (DUF4010 family)